MWDRREHWAGHLLQQPCAVGFQQREQLRLELRTEILLQRSLLCSPPALLLQPPALLLHPPPLLFCTHSFLRLSLCLLLCLPLCLLLCLELLHRGLQQLPYAAEGQIGLEGLHLLRGQLGELFEGREANEGGGIEGQVDAHRLQTRVDHASD